MDKTYEQLSCWGRGDIANANAHGDGDEDEDEDEDEDWMLPNNQAMKTLPVMAENRFSNWKTFSVFLFYFNFR